MAPLNEAVVQELLLGSAWVGQPADYAFCVALWFQEQKQARLTLGHGQTLYLVAGCHYELLSATELRFVFDSAPERILPASAFSPGMAMTVPITLEMGEFSGVENLVNWPFSFLWRLRCGRPPFPDGVFFPRPLPTEFFGYKQRL